MSTDLIEINADQPQPDVIERAARGLREGQVLAIPTDALYTLVADAFNLHAVQRVFLAKRREINRALPLFVSDHLMAEELASELSNRFYLLARRFWPGPLTVIVPASPRVPLKVTGHTGRLALRRSRSAVAQALIEALDQPLIATSANISGQPTCRSFGNRNVRDDGRAHRPGAGRRLLRRHRLHHGRYYRAVLAHHQNGRGRREGNRRVSQGVLRLLAAASLSVCVGAAAELRIGYPAMKRLLAEQVFTQDGRKYVRGTPSTRCDFAYLENPDIVADGGSLLIRARFSGRTARSLFGRCVGLGDSFDLAIHAAPYYEEGFLAFRNVRVDASATSYYSRRVRAALATTLEKQFRYDVASDAKRLLEQPAPKAAYRQELVSFTVPAIQVAPEALVVTIDFVLAVQ